MRFLIHRRVVCENLIALGPVADRVTPLKRVGIRVATGVTHVRGPLSDYSRGCAFRKTSEQS